ncbi:MAG: family 1 glycosylhydrolase [Candidatus Dojkabacteria bacterium]
MYINTSFLDKVVKYIDFLGLNFYFHNKVGIKGLRNDNDRVSDLGWWLDPGKLFNVIKDIDERYHVPIFVTENGVADCDDVHREWWISESVKAMHKAISSGSNIIGYLHWSLLDNFEWDKGYWPQFGLCKIDPKTKNRVIRDSGRFYSKIIEKNGIIEQE